MGLKRLILKSSQSALEDAETAPPTQLGVTWGRNKAPKQPALPSIAENRYTATKTDPSVASKTTDRTITASSGQNMSTGQKPTDTVQARTDMVGQNLTRELDAPARPGMKGNNPCSVRTTATRAESTRASMARGKMENPRGVPLTGENLRKKVNIKPGDIVNLPTHTAEPYHDDNSGTYGNGSGSSMLTEDNGWVFSKRRFAIVLWVFEEEFFAVPTYTNGSKGLLNKQEWEKLDYVCVKRSADDHQIQNSNGSLEIKVNISRIDTSWSYAHLLGGIKINYQEHYAVIDQLIPKGYDKLTQLWFTKNIVAYAAARKQCNLPALANLNNFAYIDPKAAYTKPATLTGSKWNDKSMTRGSIIEGNVAGASTRR